MRRLLLAVAALAAAAGTAFAAAAAAGPSPAVREPVRIHVIEHAVSDTVTDLGATGDSAGDLLTFANPIFDGRNEERAGRDQGDCIRIVAGGPRGSWECRWITFLQGGALTVEGAFFDNRTSLLAVTGGTGKYRNARGQMLLRARPGGTEFDLFFQIEP
jgi:allene oxide cyclase